MSCLLVAHSFTHRKKRGRLSVSLVSEVGNDVFHRFCFGSFFCFFSLTFPKPLSLFFSTATSSNSRSLNLLYFISCFTRLLTFTLDASLFFCRFSSNCNGFYPFTLLGERCPFSRGKFFFFVFFFVFLFVKHNTRPDVGVKLLFAMFYGYFSHLEGMCQHSFCSAVK